MTAVTWYAFQDPKSKREYYYEPVSNKTTWTLPITSGTVKSSTGKPPAVPASPASPISIASDSFATSLVGIKVEDAKIRTKTERNESGSITRGFGKRDVLLTIGKILLLNTLCLGILVKVMNSSSVVDLSPIRDHKSVPSVDDDRLETVDVGVGSEDNEDLIHLGIDKQNESSDAAAEGKDREVHNNYEAEEEYDDSEWEVQVNETIQQQVEEESCVDESNSTKQDNAEEDSVPSEGMPSSGDQENEDTEELLPDGSMLFVDKEYEDKEATVHDSSTSKRLTRAKIFSIITPIVGFGAARMAIVLITKFVLSLSPPVAPVVVAQASGPMAIIKTFFDRILGKPSPVLKDPTLMEKLADFFAKFSKIK